MVSYSSSWKQKLEEKIIETAYKSGCIETIFNTSNPEKRKNGWIFKGGTNSIYIINLRNAGNSPELTHYLGYTMGKVIEEEIKPEYDKSILIGVEMAGIPLVSAISEIAYTRSKGKTNLKWGYTRPLPGEKVRTPPEVVERLKELKQKETSLGEWGSHNLVEGTLFDGCNVIIVDDTATDFGSKLIAREVINYEAEKRDVDITCKHVLIGINREEGAAKIAKKENMDLYSAVSMKSENSLHVLKDLMPKDQYYYLDEFIKNPSLFQDVGRDLKKDGDKGKSSQLMEEALKLAASLQL